MKLLDHLELQGDLTLLNPTVGDGAAARKRELVLQGKTAAGVLHTLLRIIAQHEGSAADQKAEVIVYANDGNDGTAPTEVARIASTGVFTFAQTPAGLLTAAAAAAAYQPIDSDLTSIAALTTTSFGRALLTLADAAALRSTAGLGTVATLASDTDGTLAANSDAAVATQKAVKTYVDNLAAGLDWKASVKAASVANVVIATLQNLSAVDGVTLLTGDRVLLRAQTDATENGIYLVPAVGPATRTTDADSGTELVDATVAVEQGTVNADKLFTCTNDSITIGATSITFANFASTIVGALLATNNLSDLADAAAARANLALGSSDTPQLAGIEVGHASDTTLSRLSAGDVAVEGNRIFRVGGADVPIADGGTGAGTAVAASDNLSTKGDDIASAGTTDLSAATGTLVYVTGTTTITALGTAAAGVERVVKFTDALTLTHNGTSLILPGSSNIKTVAGDVAVFRSLGSGNWICTSYLRGNRPPDAQPVCLTYVRNSVGSGADLDLNLSAQLTAQWPLGTGWKLAIELVAFFSPQTTTNVPDGKVYVDGSDISAGALQLPISTTNAKAVLDLRAAPVIVDATAGAKHVTGHVTTSAAGGGNAVFAMTIHGFAWKPA